jgi:peroxiredoxin
MSVLLLALRLILAGLFAISACAKLLDLSGFRRSLTDFGVPRFALPLLTLLLPCVELGLAAGLVAEPTAWFADAAALGVLLIFTIAIAINLVRGRTPECHCFGRLHSKPIGWRTVRRNLLLAGLAGVVVSQGRTEVEQSPFGWVPHMTAGQKLVLTGFAVCLFLLLFGALLLIQMLAQQGRLLLRLDALESSLRNSGSTLLNRPPGDPSSHARLRPGQRAPDFRLAGLYGETITFDSLLAKKKTTLLAFIDPGCGPCNTLMPDIAEWQRKYESTITLAVISRGSAQANLPKATKHHLTDVLLQRDSEVADVFGINGTPAMVVLLPDGSLGGQPVFGPPAIREMVAGLIAVSPPAGQPQLPPSESLHSDSSTLPQGVSSNSARTEAGSTIGDEAPALKLLGLDGKMLSLEGFRGSETLILFWNPQCGFCSQMLDSLREWDASPPSDAPKLLVVSTGSAETARAMELKSPIVLDSGFTAGRSFGVTGTPAAVLINANGEIVSEVAVGAPAVLRLGRAGTEPPSGMQHTSQISETRSA